ncbi:uncharacterized protein F4822DRAFT_430034 [Hypoxylon trugodes]|uniref:uncharacterized protein n=1 Tax=Hypoxylon trugodes TaxID=326681 RepID=UPI002195DC3C|nr:uncharacterized protein F4822DRAFT_430034 [Hypoxylon trugodes]KAI1387281.1 hypothetical protein F4822DRAFT_430034 [Hypoxylon trugodes]
MSFSPSIGDVVLLAQIAWKIAQAFTKGRNSAPAEFCEVENQLYSLSAALEAIRRAQDEGHLGRGSISKLESLGKEVELYGQNTADRVIQNCLRTLTHLDKVVQKYSVILHPSTSPSQGLRCWNKYVVKNWKKIEWTTEKGDLNTLRSQITVHTNSLNLLLGVAVNSQASEIKMSVEKSSKMIKELYEWYESNLKGSELTTDVTLRAESSAIVGSDIHYTFQLGLRKDQGEEIICRHAGFNNHWSQGFSTNPGCIEVEHMLVCACKDHGEPGLHQSAVKRYDVSYLTFPVRLATAKRSWLLYKTSDKVTNQLVTMSITNIDPGYIQILEEAILQGLAIKQADMILSQGIGNNLAYISTDTNEERIIASIGELRIARKSVESITFSQAGRMYSRKHVENIQILQYQTMSSNTAIERGQLEALQPLDYAEVLLVYGEQDDDEESDITNSALLLKRNTVLRLDGRNAIVQVDSIQTLGTLADQEVIIAHNMNVTIQLTSKEAARELYEKLEGMRMELFVGSLRYPRSDETIALRLQVEAVQCENMYISDADVTITTDAQGKHRLIIESRNKCTLISQVLADDFFNSPSGTSKFSMPTYVVQIEDHGIRSLYKYEHGFKHLIFGGTRDGGMFKLVRDLMSTNLGP